jgi:hypothetical protein
VNPNAQAVQANLLRLQVLEDPGNPFLIFFGDSNAQRFLVGFDRSLRVPDCSEALAQAVMNVPGIRSRRQARDIYEGDRKAPGFVSNHARAFSLGPEVLEAWRVCCGTMVSHCDGDKGQ